MNPPRRLPDRLFFALFMIGVCGLFFIAGAGAIYFEWPLARPVIEAFEGGKSWVLKQQETVPPGMAVSAPHDALSAVVKWDSKLAQNGYTLISYAYSSTVYLVDMQGKVVHSWNMPFRKAWPKPEHVHLTKDSDPYIETAQLFPNGDLIVQYSSVNDTPYGYGMAKIDKDSKLLWTFSENAHHDFYIDKPSGTIYALTQTVLRQPTPGLENFTYPLLTDSIVILSPEGKPLDRISVLDAFLGTPYESYMHSASIAHIPNILTWDALHINSIVKIEPGMIKQPGVFGKDQVMISSRNLGALFVIDLKTKKIVWAYRGFWNYTHAAQLTPDGNVIVFDNQGYKIKKDNVSRVLEFDPLSGKILWHFEGAPGQPLHSYMHDRIQRLANGNTLIGDGQEHHVFEVTRDGKVVWDYKVTQPNIAWLGTVRRYSAQDVPFLK